MANSLSLIHLGTTIAGAFFVFCALGYWADQHFGWGYVGTISGSVLALIYVFYIVWQELNKVN